MSRQGRTPGLNQLRGSIHNWLNEQPVVGNLQIPMAEPTCSNWGGDSYRDGLAYQVSVGFFSHQKPGSFTKPLGVGWWFRQLIGWWFHPLGDGRDATSWVTFLFIFNQMV